MNSLRVPLALGLLSAGGLLLEIVTTRLLSVLYFSTFTYLVLSIAVLGLAAGAALATFLPEWRRRERWGDWAALAALLALAVTVYAVVSAPWTVRYLLFPLTALPYLFLGLTLSSIFSANSGASSRLYFADLAGATAGVLVAVPLLDLLGGLTGMFAAALLPAVAALLLSPGTTPQGVPRKSSLLPPLALLACLLALAAQTAGLGLELDLRQMATPKPLRERLLEGATVTDTRWDSFARSDLVRTEAGQHIIYLDGGAGSVVPTAATPEVWLRDIGALAFAVEPTESAFLIGPGGGLDIALARAFGTEYIAAAEVNRGAVELTRSLEELTGNLYGPGVELTVDDGRSALRRSQRRFDLILLSQVVAQNAEVRGMALAENGLYTVEAFSEYLDSLTDNGRIAIKLYDELTLTRAMVTALTALIDGGATPVEATNHLFAALDTRTTPPLPMLMVSSRPLDRIEAVAWAREAESRGFALLLVPGLLEPPPLDRIAAGEAGVESILAGAEDVNLQAPRDDRPYFYQFELGLPRSLQPLSAGVLLLLLVTLITAYLSRIRLAAEQRTAPLLFAGVGAGFMLFEIAVLQKAQLLIGHPSLSLVAVLGSLLLGAALGSALSDRVKVGQEFHWLARLSLLIATVVVAWLLLWPAASSALRGLSPGASALAVGLLLIPVALPLGAPFPLLLRAAGRLGSSDVALGWTVNGVASVAGAVGATAIALVFGLSGAIVTAAVCYAALFPVSLLLARGGS